MATEPRILSLSWQDLDRDARALAGRLVGNGPWKGVVAVTRGGLTPALLVARELGVRVIDTIGLTSYEGRDRGEVSVLKAPERALAEDGEGWLVIDDLVDSGATAAMVRRLLPRAHLAVVYAKPDGRDTADTYLTDVSWIVFPWEADEA